MTTISLLAAAWRGEDPPGEQQPVLEVRAVLVAVPGQLGERPGPDLAGVVGEADDRQVVARVLRPDERVERDRDLLGRQEAAAQQHRAAHVDEQDGRGPGQLLGPVDLEVVGREADRRRPRRRRRGVLLARRARWTACRAGRGGTGRRTRTAWSSRRARRPGRPRSMRWPPNASRCEPREQVVEDLLADPPAAPRRELQPLARRGSGSRPPRAGGRGRRARRGRAPRRRRAGRATSSRSMRGEVGRATRRRDSASSSRSIAWSRPICASAPSSAERLVAAERHAVAEPAGQQQVEVRGELGEVTSAAGRRAAARPSSTASSARCSGRHRAQQRLHRGHPLRRAGR